MPLQVVEAPRALTTLIDETSKDIPPGSEHVIAMMKPLVNNANAGFEQLDENAKDTVVSLPQIARYQ